MRLISLDFSRAFDTVNHSYLATILAQLPIPDHVYNWILALLKNRSHCTKFNGNVSNYTNINASIIQGSGMGPSNFITVISKLIVQHKLNRLLKYADDSYLLIPASNISTTSMELASIEAWASSCNLKLNASKTKELIITLPYRKSESCPPEYPGLTRVRELRILGVTITDKMGFEPHVERICTQAKQSLYAIRLLCAHGLSGVRLQDIVRATTMARILYASPAWFGFTNEMQRTRINAVIKKFIRYGYLPKDQLQFETLNDKADSNLFLSTLHNPGHVLHNLLPPVKITNYSLRPRKHNRIIPQAGNFQRRGFIFRMLYS